jgi:hypothetical protein
MNKLKLNIWDKIIINLLYITLTAGLLWVLIKIVMDY